jgi:hypothetical protein
MNQRSNTRMSLLSTLAAFGLLLMAGGAIAQEPTTLTFKEARHLFLWADTFKPLKEINETTKVAEVWNTDDADELLGWAVVKTMTFDAAQFSLLIGIRKKDGAISKVIVKGMDDLPNDFLAQFEGRKLHDSFEIARTSEDVIYLPRKIKPIRDRVKLSEEMAKTVEEALSSLSSAVKMNQNLN